MKQLQHNTGYSSDEAVIEEVLAGNTAVFELLIRRYNPLLYKIARTFGFNHQDAEDLMQESFVAAYRQLSGFRKEAAFKTWLTRIHLNHCSRKWNKRNLEEPASEWISERTAVLPAEEGTAGTDHILRNELGRVLEQSLQELPVIYRTVFVLREVEGFSVAETAALLDITPINVKVRCNRARAMLQQQLEKFYTTADLFGFHLRYCDKIVRNVLERIASAPAE
jgi:RNA polymerase sigma factor (sigma-70 family)